jgi:transposase-like protein
MTCMSLPRFPGHLGLSLVFRNGGLRGCWLLQVEGAVSAETVSGRVSPAGLGVGRLRRTVVAVAAALGVAQSCLYRWKQQDLIDRGLKGGPSRAESAELAAARQRIQDLEEEVKIELVLGHGITVRHNTVALLMQRAGLSGLPLRRKAKRVPAAVTVTDLVKRDFTRDAPNRF